eukprot:c5990_g1_i1.p1 GENE.c5990_g1_i1~~c5990_g1_i1.p1  ORF type:complete len:568 (+),score=90.27 c5990_g1_i1:204-1706(+)
MDQVRAATAAIQELTLTNPRQSPPIPQFVPFVLSQSPSALMGTKRHLNFFTMFPAVCCEIARRAVERFTTYHEPDAVQCALHKNCLFPDWEDLLGSSEVGMTSVVAASLAQVMFTVNDEILVTHQALTHRRSSSPSAADITFFRRDTEYKLRYPILVCDAKLDEKASSVQHTRLYCLDVQTMFETARPVLAGLFLTNSEAGLELYVPLAGHPEECRYAYLPIASVSTQSPPRDISAFFETIKFLTLLIRDIVPLETIPLHPAALAIDGTVTDRFHCCKDANILFRARLYWVSGFIHKVYGPIPLTESNEPVTSDDDQMNIPLVAGPLVPIASRMRLMVQVMEEIGDIQNISFEADSQFAVLKYEYVQGAVLSANQQIYGSVFGQVFEALKTIHTRDFVFADMRPENIIVVAGGKSAVLIDFDLMAPVNTRYPDWYEKDQTNIPCRPKLGRDASMTKEHDLDALWSIMRGYNCDDGAPAWPPEKRGDWDSVYDDVLLTKKQ